eukprot:CAMPEP_0196661536 /NCGR_PEP_ID=MMETSP1086-20130531/44734_1 /TAXON_ID=77921 /ORGANISM="Cyanoptyche  gloeocystis , Strain SAG4.97" /LENGTH=95 /DNA_ID=CAMNT_0041996477 /DNA_START=503 /DNA_END=790 /DNA_ORIENTATION=+
MIWAFREGPPLVARIRDWRASQFSPDASAFAIIAAILKQTFSRRTSLSENIPPSKTNLGGVSQSTTSNSDPLRLSSSNNEPADKSESAPPNASDR